MTQNYEKKLEFINNYFELLTGIMARMDRKAIAEFLEGMRIAKEAGNTVFIAGNGGSAATASHMANDFGAMSHKLGEGCKPLRALALTDNMAFFSAIGNDDGYDEVFRLQLEVHYRPGDALVVISASGNSPNVIKAVEFVKKQGGKTYGFLGFDGGKLKSLCDIAIVAETDKGLYGPVEDIHMILDHLAMSWLSSV